MRRICLLLGILCWVGTLHAQLEVLDANTPPLDAENLIRNVFLGEGVDVSNVTFDGDDAAIGFFKNGVPALGIERGIVMTSGRAASNVMTGVVGAEGNGNAFAGNSTSSNATDPDVTQVASDVVRDLAIFTITFTPISDTLEFKYVFASEEYPSFVCSDFNDVFGFFISGPGISGPFENNGANIALIPGTNLPVTINNLNSGMVGSSGMPINCSPPNGSLAYSQFYVNNNNSPTQPVYNGLTTVLTARAIVMPCETYTIKLTVADVGDDALDSGVFLEAKSFGTGTLDVVASTLSLDGAVAEGCEPATLTFEVPIPPKNDFPLDYTILGTAINGVDYQTIPSNLFIPAGDTLITIPVIPINDGIVEGEETILIDIQLNPCTRDTILIKIADNPLLPPPLIEDTIICPGETVFQDVTLPVPIPPPASFSNNMVVPIDTEFVARSSDIDVSGVFPELLGPGVIQSVCINIEHRWVDDLDIFLVTPGGQFVELSTDNGADGDDYTNTCFTPEATTVISSPGPVAPASAAPFTGDWLPEGPWSDLYGGPTNGTWQLLVSDDSPGFDGEILDWTITFNKIFDIFYEWTPDMNISCSDCPMVDMIPPDSTTYVLNVTDTYGCRIVDSIEIAVLDTLPPPDINCDSITNSSITFAWDTIPGSTGYEVNIDGGGWMLPNNGDFSQLMNGLGLADTITIEVRGISLCGVRTDTLTCFTPVCAVPDLLVDSIKAVSCTGGSDGTVMVSGMGGVGGFVYTLDADTNTTGMFDNLSPGVYEIMVSDAISCSRTIEIEILEPNPILLNMVLIDTLQCFGDTDATATVVVNGGTPPYTFLWDGIQMDSIANNLGEGLHSVVVTDARDCSLQEDIMILEPSILMTNIFSTNVLCNGGNTGVATVTPSGGTSPYTFLWDANAANQMTASATALTIGIYQVTITDENNCTIGSSIPVNEPTELTGDITFENPLCPQSTDGTATVFPTGGTMPYNFLWSDPAASTLDSAINLGGEEYFVTVTDGNGCTFDTSALLVSPDTFVLVLSSTDVGCFGENTGTATATVMNITGPETYLWSNMASTATIDLLAAQQYCVTVTDANGCEQSDCITITEPLELQAAATKTSAGCTGQSEGTIDLTVIGGESPYSFAWSNGSFSEDLANLPKGDYTVIVTDANSCTTMTTVTIEEGAPYTLAFNVENLSCSNENDGSIDLTSNGSIGITYQWTGPNGFVATTEDLDGLSPGKYVVMALDPQGCSVTDSVDVNGPDLIIVDYNIDEISCFGAQDGRVFFEIDGGTGPYSYAFGEDTILQNLSFFMNLSGGTYPYTIQDAFGCEVSDSLTLVEPQELIITLGPRDEILLGETYTFLTEINFPNSIIDSIVWDPIDSLSCIDCLTPTVDPEYTREYTIEIFAQNGCTTKGHILLIVDRQVSVYIPSAFSPNGDRVNDVFMVYGKAGSITEVKRFEVFSRWGAQVHGAYDFQVNDESAGWDGLLNQDRLNEAVYTWLVEIELLDGSREVITGDVLIQY